jgi:hypothetical protein
MTATEVTPELCDLNRLWYRFQELAEFRVMEGNSLAGERLWETVKSPGLTGTLTIRSTRQPREFVECAVDPKTFVLTCKFGARPPAALEFPAADPATRLLEETLTQVLDSLVWTEDDAEQAAAGSER